MLSVEVLYVCNFMCYVQHVEIKLCFGGIALFEKLSIIIIIRKKEVCTAQLHCLSQIKTQSQTITSSALPHPVDFNTTLFHCVQV